MFLAVIAGLSLYGIYWRWRHGDPFTRMQEEIKAQMKQAERFEEQAERESQEQSPFDVRERQTPQGKRARVGVKRVTEVEDAVIVDEISRRS